MTFPGGVSPGGLAAATPCAMTPARDGDAPRPRSAAALLALASLALIAFAGFLALGVWQVERRAWKLDLIQRVETRVRAPAVAAPGTVAWPEVSADRDEYRHVSVTGVFEPAGETLVQAATDLGAGYWVLTPLRTSEGFSVLVNRGFVSPEKRDHATRTAPDGEATVTGLLRITEPRGAFLRDNDPAANLWRSRDVAAIAEARGLTDAAPYFIDADAAPNPGGWPVGGLTVIAFHNSHLIYAITWFVLAGMVAAGFAVVFAHERRLRQGAAAVAHGSHADRQLCAGLHLSPAGRGRPPGPGEGVSLPPENPDPPHPPRLTPRRPLPTGER